MNPRPVFLAGAALAFHVTRRSLWAHDLRAEQQRSGRLRAEVDTLERLLANLQSPPNVWAVVNDPGANTTTAATLCWTCGRATQQCVCEVAP